MKKNFDFKIGADPEFNILINSMRMNARAILQSLTTANSAGVRVNQGGLLGWDGCDATAELRPNPSNNPHKVADNIEKMIRKAHELLAFSRNVTTSERAPVGGHVHLELPKEMLETRTEEMLELRGELAREAQIVLGNYWLPLLLGEDENNVSMRRGTVYGKLLDCKLKTRTLEFRTPTAEWITTRKTAVATLSYLGVVWHEYLNNPESFRENSTNFLQEGDTELENMLSIDSGQILGLMAKEIASKVRKFKMYQNFKQEVELALNPNRMLKLKRDANYDVYVGWKLEKSEHTPSGKMLRKKLPKNPTAQIKKLQYIATPSYNQDRNVSKIAKHIGAVIVNTNWRLINDYYLFGLRKNIEKPVVCDHSLQMLKHDKIPTVTHDEAWAKLKDTLTKMMEAHEDINGETFNDSHRKKRIMIGIPYDWRNEETPNKLKYREVIELIAEIEKKCMTREKSEFNGNTPPEMHENEKKEEKTVNYENMTRQQVEEHLNTQDYPEYEL
jgi:hypothetical protein